MEIKKKLDLGEYIIKVTYEDSTGSLEVVVLDELETIIESINITNSDDDENDENDDKNESFNPNLN